MAAKPPAKPKPRKRKPKPSRAPLGGIRGGLASRLGEDLARLDPRGTLDEIGRRLVDVEGSIGRIEARIDKMADALAPALHAWRNIRARIPGWILSLGDSPRSSTPADRESPSGDSEE